MQNTPTSEFFALLWYLLLPLLSVAIGGGLTGRHGLRNFCRILCTQLFIALMALGGVLYNVYASELPEVSTSRISGSAEIHARRSATTDFAVQFNVPHSNWEPIWCHVRQLL